MKRIAGVFSVTAILMFSVLAGDAHATSIAIPSPGSDSFDIFWSKTVGSTQLTALGQFKVDVTDTYADFYVTLTNNTVASANEMVHSIGFNSDPNGTSIYMKDGGNYFTSLGLDQTFASYKKIDICTWTTNNCSGGAQGSNLPGGGAPVGTDTFSFRLNGDFSDGLVLNNFVIKFQGDLGSFEFGDSSPTIPTPEPSSLILLTSGGLAALIRKNKKR